MGHAKELRQNATDAENKLWYFLQKNNLGVSFRRQHPIGDYIADFACLEKKLIVEIDGGQHAQEQKAYDEKRTVFLEKAGYRILRFWNNEALANVEGVLQNIAEALREETHPPSPPASGGIKAGFNLLAVTNGTMPEKPESFERILDIFNGNDSQAVEKARARWSAYKNAGHDISYMRQSESGGWEKAA